MLSQIDIQLETGEYFLNDKVKSAKKWQEKQEKQSEKTAENKRKREAAFIPPKVGHRCSLFCLVLRASIFLVIYLLTSYELLLIFLFSDSGACGPGDQI